jgi:hypothetical protein
MRGRALIANSQPLHKRGDLSEPLTPPRETIGDKVRLLTRGKLPYKIRWQSEIVQANPAHGFIIRATGDFDGRGIWSLNQQGSEVVLTFDWRLRTQKPLLRNLSWLFKPPFRWNHRWAMARGEEGLSREMMSAGRTDLLSASSMLIRSIQDDQGELQGAIHRR